MSDELRDKRRNCAQHYGSSRKGFYKSEQKRRAKRALERELQREQVRPHGPEPEDIAPDPAPENALWDPNWESIDWDEDDAALVGFS